MLVFSLREYGHSFATRGRGDELRRSLVASIGDESEVALDFADVAFVTYSFADEFAGRLPDDLPAVTVEVRNASPTIANTLERAQRARALHA